ncbi:hypothetical protein NMY22_g18824 [Coprinellus aureogranulatus]|nr:hypothetical protein NMY22_g18824 [Coprinellus aureogranulatus]
MLARIILRKAGSLPASDPTKEDALVAKEIVKIKAGKPSFPVSKEDIVDAFSRGDEAIDISVLKCVAYDRVLADDIAAKSASCDTNGTSKRGSKVRESTAPNNKGEGSSSTIVDFGGPSTSMTTPSLPTRTTSGGSKTRTTMSLANMFTNSPSQSSSMEGSSSAMGLDPDMWVDGDATGGGVHGWSGFYGVGESMGEEGEEGEDDGSVQQYTSTSFKAASDRRRQWEEDTTHWKGLGDTGSGLGSTSAGPHPNSAGGFEYMGLFYVDPPPLEDLEPPRVPPERFYARNDYVPPWYHSTPSSSTMRLPPPPPPQPKPPEEFEVHETPEALQMAFEEFKNAYLGRRGYVVDPTSSSLSSSSPSMEREKGKKRERSQTPPLTESLSPRIPKRRNTGAAGAGLTSSSGIATDPPPTLPMSTTPESQVGSQRPVQEQTQIGSIAGPSSSSTTDQGSGERNWSQTPLQVAQVLRPPPVWRGHGGGVSRTSSGLVAPAQATATWHPGPFVQGRVGPPAQVFSSSADFAVHYDAPANLPSPPKLPPLESRGAAQANASRSPHAAFEAMGDSYLRMLNTKYVPLTPMHGERSRELAARYGIREATEEMQTDGLLDYLASPKSFTDKPCFGKFDMDERLIESNLDFDRNVFAD